MQARPGTQDPVGTPGDGLLRPSVVQWAKVTDDLDQLDLALRMTALREELDPEWAEAALTRARLLLLSDRPDEALTVLSAAGFAPPGSVPSLGSALSAGSAPSAGAAPSPAEAHLSGPDLLVAAVFAANGDNDCYRQLIAAMGSAQGGTQRWSLAYLLAAAAHARGDVATADQTWLDLVDGLGIVTRLTLSRSAVARMAQRPSGWAGRSGWTEGPSLDGTIHPVPTPDATAQILAAALSFQALSPVADPGPVIDAAEELRRQGDRGGARLLLRATTQIHGPIPAVQAALAGLTPTRSMRWYRLRAALMLLGAVLLVPLGILAVPLILAGRAYWNRNVLVPGLTASDSQAWRRIETLPLRPGRNVLDGGGELSGIQVLGFVFLEALGFTIALEIPSKAIGFASIMIWLTAMVAFPLAGMVVLNRVRRHRDRLAYWHRQKRAPVDDAQTCQCRRSTVLTGDAARAYLGGHLHDATPSDPVRAILGPDATLAVCPDTQIVWLGTDLASGRPGYAFRGAASAVEAGPSVEIVPSVDADLSDGALEQGDPRGVGHE
jgi:hypothetical protein